VTRVEVDGFEQWRAEARRLIVAGVAPEAVLWHEGASAQDVLPLGAAPAADARAGRRGRADASARAPRVPRRFVEQAELAACHRDPQRWALLYRLLWRLQQEGSGLLAVSVDPDVHALERLAAQVRHDVHKMHAYVRFVPVREDDGERFVAFYRPDHHIVRRAAPFFADRFNAMRWSILTPDESAHWDGRRVTFGAGVAAPPDGLDGDAVVTDLWRTYYASMFNPARLNMAATLREMPRRRWPDLPEAALIPQLVATAHERVAAMPLVDREGARPYVPDTYALDGLRAAAPACRGCPLHERATQAVFGEGPGDARLVLVGEQPGDEEDRRGRPFVGPAGQVLDRALAAAGIDRAQAYVTNAVKHFSFETRGTRRIHQKPKWHEVKACRPWLEREIQSLRPQVLVCLGGTAAQALLGPQARVMAMRGRVVEHTAWASAVVVTVHPSAVLRADDGERYFQWLVEDLGVARGRLHA
jgi:probable DNA metabolism protein